MFNFKSKRDPFVRRISFYTSLEYNCLEQGSLHEASRWCSVLSSGPWTWGHWNYVMLYVMLYVMQYSLVWWPFFPEFVQKRCESPSPLLKGHLRDQWGKQRNGVSWNGRPGCCWCSCVPLLSSCGLGERWSETGPSLGGPAVCPHGWRSEGRLSCLCLSSSVVAHTQHRTARGADRSPGCSCSRSPCVRSLRPFSMVSLYFSTPRVSSHLSFDVISLCHMLLKTWGKYQKVHPQYYHVVLSGAVRVPSKQILKNISGFVASPKLGWDLYPCYWLMFHSLCPLYDIYMFYYIIIYVMAYYFGNTLHIHIPLHVLCTVGQSEVERPGLRNYKCCLVFLPPMNSAI